MKERLRSFIAAHRRDICALSLIAAVFGLLCWLGWGRQMAIGYDSGREAYIPMRMLEGRLLYRDILSLFAPLAYQINAALFFLFGKSLNVLQTAGTINALLICGTLYAIARRFTTPLASGAALLLILGTSVFNFHLSNFISPYSYAIVYALSAVLLSLYFLLCHAETGRLRDAILCWGFLGVSIACKYDFAPYLLVPAVYFLFMRRLKWRELAYCLAALLAVPAASFGLLFLQGLRLQDILEFLDFTYKFAKTPSLIYFNSEVTGALFSAPLLRQTAALFLFTRLPFILLGFALAYVFFLLRDKIAGGFLRALSLLILLVPFYISLRIPYRYLELSVRYTWLGMFSALLAAAALFMRRTPKPKREAFFLLAFSSALVSAHSFFCMMLWSNGAFNFPLPLLVLVIFTAEIIPDAVPAADRRHIRAALALLLLLEACNFISTQVRYFSAKRFFVHGQRGSFSVFRPDNRQTVQALMDYVGQKTAPQDRVMILPENLMPNFMADRASLDKRFILLPPHVEAMGEDAIIADIARQRPEVIIFSNEKLSIYNTGEICADYAQNLCAYVKKNYRPDIRIGSDGDNWLEQAYRYDIYRLIKPSADTAPVSPAK